MSSQINIVTFLTKVLTDTEGGAPGCVNVTPDERQWIEKYLYDPHIELHLRVRENRLDDTVNSPRPVDEHFFIKGDEVDIFTLLQSIVNKSPLMAWIIQALAGYIYRNIPTCPICERPHYINTPCLKPGEWTFNIKSNEQTNNNTAAPAGGL